MRALPDHVRKYSETPVFTEQNIPAKLTAEHSTKPGVWGRLVVLEGAVDYFIAGPPQSRQRIAAGDFGVIEPEKLHHVELLSGAAMRVEFYR